MRNAVDIMEDDEGCWCILHGEGLVCLSAWCAGRGIARRKILPGGDVSRKEMLGMSWQTECMHGRYAAE